tara:strand:- start:1527 stop:2705 length:1179 start_codon:yes stop_codon:yes gene_type:complete
MKLAFYYHIPVAAKEGGLFLPGYIGVFVDELARNIDKLYLVMHEAKGREYEEADYQLECSNITFVNLGTKTPSWQRSLSPGKILKEKMREIKGCDAFLVRSPSPLAPYFHKYIKNPKLFFLIVGDYAEGAKQIGTKGLKNKLLYMYFHHNDKKFRKRLPKTDIFVNSPELFEKYKNKSKSIELVKTTTLREEDFYKKPSIAFQDPIRLLFTGRIEPAKGLIELLEAGKRLIDDGKNIQIDIVGWENNPQKPFEKKLITYAKLLGISNNITFHGKKKLGPDLNQYYRNSDIYVLPSYHEGFPRTIWEAMANSLPVIATKVGGISFFLKSKKHAILIEPKNSNAIAKAIELLINDDNLREKIISNGYDLSKSNSLKMQTKKLANLISKLTFKKV